MVVLGSRPNIDYSPVPSDDNDHDVKRVKKMKRFSSKKCEILRFILVGIVVALALEISLHSLRKGKFGIPLTTDDLLMRCDQDNTTDELVKGPMAQDDPRLIKYIKEKAIDKPSGKPYNMTTLEDTSFGQVAVVRRILGDLKGGFFVEAGAFDGEGNSNTYYLERYFNWTGLLVEPDETNYRELLQKNRNAYGVKACLSSEKYPAQASFLSLSSAGRIIPDDTLEFMGKSSFATVQCYPLYSLLLALNRTEIDYLSLDIEGAEIKVLNTIPYDQLKIKVISAEFNVVEEGKQMFKMIMEKNDYVVYDEVVNGSYAADFVFVHKDIKPKVPKN